MKQTRPLSDDMVIQRVDIQPALYKVIFSVPFEPVQDNIYLLDDEHMIPSRMALRSGLDSESLEVG